MRGWSRTLAYSNSTRPRLKADWKSSGVEIGLRVIFSWAKSGVGCDSLSLNLDPTVLILRSADTSVSMQTTTYITQRTGYHGGW